MNNSPVIYVIIDGQAFYLTSSTIIPLSLKKMLYILEKLNGATLNPISFGGAKWWKI